jgi:hypothetical protein
MQLNLPADKAQKIKLWILIPAAGDLIHATFSGHLIRLLGLLRQHGIWYELRYLPGDSLVTRARNNLADIFLTASSDDDQHFALWLDCDILFDPASVLQMLSLDLDFVAAPYSKKGFHVDRMAEAARLGWPNDRVMRVVGTPNVNWLTHPIRCDIPMPVLEAGSGFWLIKRKVFRMMAEADPAIRYRRAPEEQSHYGTEFAHDFFRVGVWPETQEYLSEDWWFCRTWRALGGLVHCCFWIVTHHIGPHLYPMDMPAIADLLTATGGYINAETRPKEPHATTQVRTAGTPEPLNGGAGTVEVRAGKWTRFDSPAPDQAAGARCPGPLGD